jgi:hypothetical protein
MKIRDVRIMNDQQTLSPTACTREFTMDSLQLNLKYLVLINSLLSSMTSFPRSIRYKFHVFSLFCSLRTSTELHSQFSLSAQLAQRFPSRAFVDFHHAQDTSRSRHGDLSERREGRAEQQNQTSRPPKRLDPISTRGHHSQRRGRKHFIAYRRGQNKSCNS